MKPTRTLPILFTVRNALARVYPTMKHPKTHPCQNGAHDHYQIQTASVIKSALYTLRTDAVVEEMEGGLGYCEGDCHGDRESHCKVRSSGDPFRRLLWYQWEEKSKNGSQELVDQGCQCQRKL
jgi:hypothetical protein